MALPFGMSLSPWIFTKLMDIILVAAHLCQRDIFLFPYLDDWLVRDLICNRLISHTTYCLQTVQNLGFIPNLKKSDLIPTQKFTYIGMEFLTTEYSQGTSRPSRLSYSDYQNIPFSVSSFGKNFPFSFGQTECSSGLHSTRQTSFTTSANVSIIGLETSHSSSRSSGFDQQYDQIPFKMVDEHKSFCSRNAHSSSRSQCIPLYGCQSLWMGSSSRTNESILSWSLAGRPIPTPYQYTGNNSHSFRTEESLKICSPFLCHDFYRQHNSGLLYQQTRRNLLSQPLCRGRGGDAPLVPGTTYSCQGSSYPRQIQCFVRPPIENGQTSQNRMGNRSISRELNFPNVQFPQCGSVCDSLQSQISIVCFSRSGQTCLSDRRFFCVLEPTSCLCISSNNIDSFVLAKKCQSQCRIVLIAPLWPQRPGFSEVLQLLVSAPVRLPLFPKLLTQAKGKFQHPNLLLLNLHAWELSNNQSLIKIFCKTLQILSQNQDEPQLRKSMMQNGLYVPTGVIERRLIQSRPLLL